MDHFGTGAAIEGAIRICTQAARGTGRTTSMVDSVKDGDRICFTNSKEADRVKRRCLERGVKIECIVVKPEQAGRVFEHRTPQGRLIFDHSLITLGSNSIISKLLSAPPPN